MTKVFKNFIILLFFLRIVSAVSGQGTNTRFGQNRVPYQDFNWKYITATNFEGYYYENGKSLAEYAVRVAESSLNRLEKSLGYRLSGKIQLLVFNDLNGMRQNNLGLTDPQFNSGGYTYIVDNKIPVYFPGNHPEFERQIKRGVALVLLNEMMYGGSIHERVQNAALLVLPSWYMMGLVSYLSLNWDIEMDNRMRDGMATGALKKFNNLMENEAIFAGHSIWKFIAEKYGAGIIPQILYVTRLNRSFDNALYYVLGTDMKSLVKEWAKYYERIYEGDDAGRTLPTAPEKMPDKIIGQEITGLKISPDARFLAIVTNSNGAYKVWLYDRNDLSAKIILRGGFRSLSQKTNYSFPIVSWFPGDKNLGILEYYKGKYRFIKMNVETGLSESFMLEGLESIYHMDHSESGKSLVLSGVKSGQTDLFTYDLAEKKLLQLTNDVFDDQFPRFVNGDKFIIFNSNRFTENAERGMVQGAGARTSDIFLLNLQNTSGRLLNLTNTPYFNETKPNGYGKDYYTFLSDENGIKNSFAIKYRQPGEGDFPMPAGKAFPLTNYRRNVILQDVSQSAEKVVELIYFEGRYQVHVSDISGNVEKESENIELVPTIFRQKLMSDTFFIRQYQPQKKPSGASDDTLEKSGDLKSDTTEWYFQSGFENLPEEPDEKDNADSLLALDKLDEGTQGKPYRLSFTPAFFVTQLDNSIINTYYVPMSLPHEVITNQGINFLLKVSISDLFRDYIFDAGFRIEGGLDGSDIFFNFSNLKNRLDKKMSFYRQSRFVNLGFQFNRFTIHEFRYSLKYPFSDRSSLSLATFGRQDKLVILSSDRVNVGRDNEVNLWAGTKLEYVYDNTTSKGINLYNGLRFKIFHEWFQDVNSINNRVVNLGADIRDYRKIHRQLIWANRISANTSIGSKKVNYYLGGVENWISPNFNNALPVLNPGDYAFQTVATNLRGFNQNIRNGNSFFILNSELRFPVISYLVRMPLKSDFLKNFMIVPFADFGTAWVGSSPYSEDNPFNRKVIETSSLRITVFSDRNPWLGGIGGGLRTKLFGYYIKYDRAWGIEDGVLQSPINYFSLSLDF